MKFLTC